MNRASKYAILVVILIVSFFLSGCPENNNGPEEEFGTIVIFSDPDGASIFIDNTLKEGIATPASLELEPGSYRVNLGLHGYESSPESIIVNVENESFDTLDFILTEISDTGYIEVSANYDEAIIYIDGVPSGYYTPATLPLGAGSHMILAGGWSFTELEPESVYITEGDTHSVSFGLNFHRTALIEEFSHVNCTNCPNAAAAVQEVLSDIGDSIIAIEWHPEQSGGVDPFHADNAEMHDGRVDYYAFVGIPRVFVAADLVPDPTSVSTITAYVEDALNEDSPCSDFALWGHVSEPGMAKVGIKAIGDAGEGIIRMVVVENHRHYDTAPGSNGMTDFHNVPRTMNRYPATGAFGLEIGDVLYFAIEFDVPSDLSDGEYSLIAWFENDANGIFETGEEILCKPCKINFNSNF